MSREVHPMNVKGSERWLRVLINQHPHVLGSRLSAVFGWPQQEPITWLSPLASDEYAEYRDETFLTRLQICPSKVPLASFWPSKGPSWDGLGMTASGQPLLIEAKAHIDEAVTTPCGAKGNSLALIRRSVNQLKGF